MCEEYILGADIGTTATKVSLFDLKGNTIVSATKEYQLNTPTEMVVEVDIKILWDSFREGIKSILSLSNVEAKDIRTLGISAQGETLIPIAKDGQPLRKAIVWLDNRAQEEAEILRKTFDDETTYKITGQVKLVPTWPASKIFWIKRHEPDTFSRVYKYLLVEDYFLWKMTGAFVSEGSLLCSTCYWNIVTKKWWDEMLTFLDLSSDQLPEIKEPGEKVGNLLASISQEIGLSTDTIISTGALDQACGTIGVGNIQPDMFTENIGAALAICATLKKPIFDKRRRIPIHYHAIPDTYMAHTFTTGGMTLRWFRDHFCETEINIANLTNTSSYSIMDDEARQVVAGSEGLVMLPHLQGAMAPEANPKAKGVFFGFSLRHGKPHFTRAVMEAIACVIRRNIDALEDMHIQVSEIRALGGGARSQVWNQIVADLTKKPLVTTLHDEDAACLGAAMLAGKACELFSSLEQAVREMVLIKERIDPNPKNYAIYDELYKKYIKLYENLQDMFNKS